MDSEDASNSAGFETDVGRDKKGLRIASQTFVHHAYLIHCSNYSHTRLTTTGVSKVPLRVKELEIILDGSRNAQRTEALLQDLRSSLGPRYKLQSLELSDSPLFYSDDHDLGRSQNGDAHSAY